VELRQLEYFVAVGRELHFGRAAEELHVAQPSVSQQIKALEGILGVQLFERSSKVVRLTGAGRELLPLAGAILADVEHLTRVAQTTARRVGGQVRIGFLGDEYARPRAERVLGAVRRRHPRMTIEFSQVDFAEHHRALENGEVDAAFVMGPAPESIATVSLFESPRLIAISSAMAEKHGEKIVERLVDVPIALPVQMGSQAWRVAWSLGSQSTGATYVVGEESMEAMLAVVGAGRAYCIVPEYVPRFYPQPAVTFIATPDVPPIDVGIGVLRARLGEDQIEAVQRTATAVTARRACRAQPRGLGRNG
jgi:DNA-binding transcriptional LysR family regulator